MTQRVKSFWGWGYDDYQVDPKRLASFKMLIQNGLGVKSFSGYTSPVLSDIDLRSSRLVLNDSIRSICSNDKRERIAHSFGKSFRDIWRGVHNRYDNPPDYIAYPRTEEDIMNLYEFASQYKVSLIPFGGGTSVVGGIEPTKDNEYKGVITVNMKHFDKVIEIDKVSRSANIQGGVFGPALEKKLKPHGLTLRHFPQSFEFSTLGGWIATRSGGHFATLYTHIDEFVQSVRMVTPNGVLDSRRLPGSGAGPSEERLVAGSEGILGIITSAWMRLQDIPNYKLTQTVKFAKWDDAVEACRRLSQSGLNPSNARLVDNIEAMVNGLGDGVSTILIIGFESADRPMEAYMDQALKICQNCNGDWKSQTGSLENVKADKRDEKADDWKRSFLEAPYLRDEMVKLGCIVETFETAVTWDKFGPFHKEIIGQGNAALKRICGGGIMTCRFTHLYPDGPAPYYTVIAKGKEGYELEQWDEIKKVVSDAIIEYGGTITHHHAVGKDHQTHYEQQQTAVFGKAMKAIKTELDPNWILNPDVLIKR